jgi:hypothetical protein
MNRPYVFFSPLFAVQLLCFFRVHAEEIFHFKSTTTVGMVEQSLKGRFLTPAKPTSTADPSSSA